MFVKVVSSDNRESRRVKGRLVFTDGRSWTRRIQWLEDQQGNVKLKFEDFTDLQNKLYKEVLVPAGLAQTVYDRFKAGNSIDDCISIFGAKVPEPMKSRRAAQDNNESTVSGGG